MIIETKQQAIQYQKTLCEIEQALYVDAENEMYANLIDKALKYDLIWGYTVSAEYAYERAIEVPDISRFEFSEKPFNINDF
jgi:hypothetical protein